MKIDSRLQKIEKQVNPGAGKFKSFCDFFRRLVDGNATDEGIVSSLDHAGIKDNGDILLHVLERIETGK